MLGPRHRVFHHLMQTLFDTVRHLQAQTVRRFVRGNLCRVDPMSVRVPEEIVAGLH